MSAPVRKPRRRWLKRLALLAASGLVSVVLAELTLRALRGSDRFLPHFANAHVVNYPNEEVTPGVTGTSNFRTNSLGCRGPEFAGEKVKLLAVGGSTTACTALDDSESWPHLVMQNVNRARGDGYLWVTNSGIDGKNTRHHIMHAKYLLPKIDELDYVIYYCGLNDLGAWLFARSFDPHSLDDPGNWDDTIASSFAVSNYTSRELPWYMHTALWQLGRELQSDWGLRPGTIIEDNRFEWLKNVQAWRRQAKISAVPPAKLATETLALGEYRANLRRIIELTRAAGAQPILMAQFTAWDSPGAVKTRFWMGVIDGGDAALESHEYQRYVEKYNRVAAAVAAETGVPFLDLPAALEPNRDKVTIDGCHFNEFGGREVARIVSEFLLETIL